MLTVRDAKPLFALSTLLIPWNVFVFGQNLGWGLHFALFRFSATTLDEPAFRSVLQIYNLLSTGRLHVVLWGLAGVVVTLATVYVVVARIVNGSTDRDEDRVVGAAFVLGAALFVLSRVLLYDYLLVSNASAVNWFSVPVGAAYTVFVGVVFYRDWFRLGA